MQHRPDFAGIRRNAKELLRSRDLEVVVPPSRRLTDLCHTRLRRVNLPAAVTRIPDAPAPGAFWVDIDRVVNRVGFTYGRGGWHPFVAALEQRLATPDLVYGDSVLRAFFDRFRPTTVRSLLLGDSVEAPTLAGWLAVEPLTDVWPVTAENVAWARRTFRNVSELPHSQYRGPASAPDGAHHLVRVVDAYDSLVQVGYRPETFGFVSGYFLTCKDDYRFVVGHGNHRLAALSVIGYRRIAVTLRAAHPPVVARDDLARWTTSRGGLLRPEEAAAVFDHLFDSNARVRATQLGLLDETER